MGRPLFVSALTSLVAQEAQQVQKQVDEVQIELEGGEDGGLGQHVGGGGVVVVEGADLLGVIGGVGQEDHHADGAGHPVKGLQAGDEQHEYIGQDEENKPAQQDIAHPGQVDAGKVAEEGHAAEVEGGGGKDQHQAGQLKDDEIEGKGDPRQGGVEEEKGGGHGGSDLMEGGGHADGHRQLGDEEDQVEGGDIGDGVIEEHQPRVGGAEEDGHAEGDQQAQHHPQEGLGCVLP